MPTLSFFRSAKPSPKEADIKTNGRSPLLQDDVLLCIAPYLDVGTLLKLRLVSRRTNNTLKENESWVCNSVARTAYHWVFEYSDRAYRDKKQAPPHLSRFPTFKSLIRLHLATLLPLLLFWNRFKSHADDDATLVLPGFRITAACVRGFLTLWKLADIEHEVEPVPSAWLPREDYFALGEVAGSYTYPTTSRPVMAMNDFLSAHQSKDSLRIFRPMLDSLEALVQGRRLRASRKLESQETNLDEALERFNRSRAERLELVSQLDQGAWLDLHIVTTLVLAFYIAYADSSARKNSPTKSSKLSLSEWALRQGPDLILGILSTDLKRRRWIHQWIDKQWGARHERVQTLDATWTNMGPHGPLGISTATGGRYPHPKCDEWEREGWPTLAQCTKDLFSPEWRTYTLRNDETATVLADALAQRTGEINFQTRM